MAKRLCQCGCGTKITGHPNKKFFNTKHKDKYWNKKNPRGFALGFRQKQTQAFFDSVESVGHKIDPIEDELDFTDCYN